MGPIEHYRCLDTPRQVQKQTKEESSRVYSVRDERVKILVNSCIRKMDRIRMRRSRKSCAARPREGGG